MILLIVLILGGCNCVDYPQELETFAKNISVTYWFLDIERDVIPIYSLFQKNEIGANGISIYLYNGDIPREFNGFVNKVRKVRKIANDSASGQNISWTKRNGVFGKPEVIDNKKGVLIPDYFMDAFDYEAPNIAIKKKWIKEIEEFSAVSYLNWTGYLAKYDLTRAKGMIVVSEDKGELLFFISPSKNKMIESYFSNNQWDYIRYVEGGECPFSVNESDPESIIKTIWDAWQQYIIPYVDYLDMGILQ